MRPATVLIAIAVFTLNAHFAAGQQPSTGHVTPSFPWPKTSAEMQAADRMPADSLQPFLDRLKPIGVPELHPGQFRFVPMDAATVCLTATVDASGRQLFYDVAVVCPATPGSFSMTLLRSAPPHELGAELVDLDGDGIFEIVTRDLAGGYQGVETLPLFWYSIFRVKGSVPTDVSKDYKNFYVTYLLPNLDLVSRLTGTPGAGTPALAERAGAEARFLKAKYDRKIAGSPSAGLDDAVDWAGSSDPVVQMLAVKTWSDIGTAKALDGLRRLAHAANYMVSDAAANALRAKDAIH